MKHEMNTAAAAAAADAAAAAFVLTTVFTVVATVAAAEAAAAPAAEASVLSSFSFSYFIYHFDFDIDFGIIFFPLPTCQKTKNGRILARIAPIWTKKTRFSSQRWDLRLEKLFHTTRAQKQWFQKVFRAKF